MTDEKEEILRSHQKVIIEILKTVFIFCWGAFLGYSIGCFEIIIGTAIASLLAVVINLIYHLKKVK